MGIGKEELETTFKMLYCKMGPKNGKLLEVAMGSRGLCICKMRKMIASLCADRKIQERKGNIF